MMELLQGTFAPDGALGLAAGTSGSFFDSASHEYVGGMPVGIGATGLLAGASTAGGTTSNVDSVNYIGILWNNSVVDTNRGANQKGTVTNLAVAIPTIVFGPCKVRLFSGTAQNDAGNDGTIKGAPFIPGDAWAYGDLVYISTGTAATCSKWTRTKGANNFQRSYGRVVDFTASGGTTTSLTVLFWSHIQGATTSVIPV